MHSANSGIELGEEPLFADDPLAVQHEPNEMSRGERRNEQIALPRGKRFAGVEADS